MTYLTASEREQARDRVIAQLYRLPDSDAVTVPKTDLFAVLALTEQVEKLDDEVLKWTAIAGDHAEQVEALTEQQPEPVSQDELRTALIETYGDSLGPTGQAAMLLSRYTITRKETDRGE